MAIDNAYEIRKLEAALAAGAMDTRRRLDAEIIQGSLEGMAVQTIIEANRRWQSQREGLSQSIISETDIFDSMIHADTLSKTIMEAQGD
jgi:hypothetical protein